MVRCLALMNVPLILRFWLCDDRTAEVLTLGLVEEGELCIDGGAWEGGQSQQVLLQQGDVGLLVHRRHVLGQRDEEEDPADLLQLTGEHLSRWAEEVLRIHFVTGDTSFLEAATCFWISSCPLSGSMWTRLS